MNQFYINHASHLNLLLVVYSIISVFFVSLPTGHLLSLFTIVDDMQELLAPASSKALHLIPSTEMITTKYVTDLFLSFVLRTTSIFSHKLMYDVCVCMFYMYFHFCMHQLDVRSSAIETKILATQKFSSFIDTGYRIAICRFMISFVTVNAAF